MLSPVLQSLLSPRSIAIIGASDNPQRIGGRPLANLVDWGFAGKIFPINPGRDSVQGRRAWHSVLDVDEDIDCALLAIPATGVVAALEECRQRKVGAAVIFSAGFAELGAEGAAVQQRVTQTARESGMRILGPNTTGLIDYNRNLILSFAVPQRLASRSRVAVVSQSGGFSVYIQRLAAMQGMALGFSAATGNECDLQCGDLVTALSEGAEIDVMLVYTEGLRSAAEFVNGLEAARRRGKQVIVLKAGSTSAGAKAVASHTATLAGEDSVYDAVFKEYGAYRARSAEEMIDVAQAALTGRLPRGNRTAVVTLTGALGVHLTDLAVEAGLDMVPATAAVKAQIDAIAPMGASGNPYDLTAQILNDTTLLEKSLDAILASGLYDNVITCVGANSETPLHVAQPLNDGMLRIGRKYPEITHSLSAWVSDAVLHKFAEAGFYTARDAARNVRTLQAMLHLAGRGRVIPAVPAAAGPGPFTGAINEWEAKSVLRSMNIATPRERLVHSREEAARAALEIGGAVALKAVSADLPHKTEHGAVRLNLRGADAVSGAFDEMASSLKALRAGDGAPVRVEGFLVSEMIAGWTECILGVQRDPVFGPVVVFGLGGVFVEALNAVSRRLAPVDSAEALAMINETPARRLLHGYRGHPPADIPALADAIVALSRYAAEQRPHLAGFEINPLAVGPAGSGVRALDAVATFAPPAQ